MEKNRILIRLENIQSELTRVTERLYDPRLETSEYKELNKKKKKLIKDIRKLEKKAAHE